MRFRFALKAALCLLALLGALYVFAYPVRTYLAQERQVAQVERTISVLGAQDAKLNSQYKLLQRTSYVDQLARADYGYVKPGQQAYEVLPPNGSKSTARSTYPGDPALQGPVSPSVAAVLPPGVLPHTTTSPVHRASATAAHPPGLLRRIFDTLEFWR